MTKTEAIEMLNKWGVLLPSEASEAVDMAIEALSAETVQGEWIEKYNGNGWNDFWDYTCSNCGKKYERADAVLYHANYCPNCGAIMSVPIQPVELKKPFKVDEIPPNYEPRILGNVEVVVRCRNCKHYRAEYGSCTAEHWDLSRVTFPHVEPNDYCSYGENKKQLQNYSFRRGFNVRGIVKG